MEDALRTSIVVAALIVAFLALPVRAASNADPVEPAFPSELQGVWDVHPWPCSASEPSDSDMRFLIEDGKRRNYEDDDTLASIEQIADAPRAWRVVSTSSLDPERANLEARIYVLAGGRLTVADDQRTEVYVRCE